MGVELERPSRAGRFSNGDYFFRFPDFCTRALPAADFDALPVRPSRRVLDAALAAGLEVCRFGALRCDSTLPAAELEDFPADFPVKVFDALPAALVPVTFLLAIAQISVAYWV